MTTRSERLSEFSQAVPPIGKAVQILAEDHCGTYIIPFTCERRDGAWYRIGVMKPIEANVIGWRRAHEKAKAKSK